MRYDAEMAARSALRTNLGFLGYRYVGESQFEGDLTAALRALAPLKSKIGRCYPAHNVALCRVILVGGSASFRNILFQGSL